MNLSMHNQALLRGILAGTVVLSGASACSRSDRAGAGRDTTQSGDTAMTTARDTARATAQTRTPQPSGDTARTTVRDTTVRSGEAAVSGYRGMERDTSSPEMAGTGAATPLDSAGVTSDYALTTDTTTAGYSEMARDTSSAAGRGNTAAVAVADTTTPAESDTAGIKVQVANADTLQDNSGRIRPPEDSTEIAGNVTSDKARAEPTSREVPTDAVGAAPIGNAVTGIEAVSLMSRAGARCIVKDDSSDVWWDMADSPAALNPCGTGTMTLSLVRTGEK